MAKDIDLAGFQLPANLLEMPLDAVSEASLDLARNSLEVREPKSAKELATQYSVSDRTFQEWFKTVCSAYPWIPLSELKTGNSNKTRYTPLCQELIAQYREAAKSFSADDWIASIHAANRDKMQASESPEVTDAEIIDDSASAPTSAITLRPSDSAIAVHQVNQIHLTVIQTQPQVDQALATLQSTLNQWTQNSGNLESALLQNAENLGTELGAKAAVAKVSKFVQASEQVEQALAAQLGLLGKPETAPNPGS